MNLSPIAAIRAWVREPGVRKRLVFLGVLGGAYVGGLAYGSWTRVCSANRCPSISILIGGGYNPQQTSKLYAADGRLITELGIERRTVLPLSQIPLAVQHAFIATEDKRFYQHHGIDFLRILGAIKANITQLRWAQGFSTITMQLARNVFPEKIPRTKRMTRKLMEARVAIEIEHAFSKDQILELYLNQIPLGSGAYGVDAAAQTYFGKSARELNVAEAATLAALAKSPEGYNPRKRPGRAVLRRNTIINLMRAQGYLSPEEAEFWKAYPLALSGRRDYHDVAPYFVEWVRQQLDARFGRDLYERGLRVYTTLDLDMQEAAERALRQQLDAIEAGVYSPGGKFGFPTYQEYIEQSAGGQDRGAVTPYLQGAFIAMEANTGYVRALVGGRDFEDSEFNRALQAQRQAGSTFKPFVYSAAIRAGHPVTELLDDSPLQTPLLQADSTYWNPKDYDDTTLGLIPMRRSLYLSRNLSTIKLGMALGEQTVIGEARRLGMTTPLPPFPAIHLGAREVYPIEMIKAYSAFANLGTRVAPIAIHRVEDQRGNILWQPTIQREEVMDGAQAWLMVDMMRDVIRMGTAYTAVWAAGFRLPAAGKTGTTDDYTDAWFVGFTPDLVASVWVGFDIPQRIMNNGGGGRIAAPAWTMFMREVYDRRPAPGDWLRPDTLITREVDTETGFLATPWCPQNNHRWDWFIPGTEPTRFCPLHSPFGAGVSAPAPPAWAVGGGRGR